ncbi:uncharacterized protein UV8b_00478 [Ustilaginoidea virens]|uniref:Uncharacterized protein n=1 Tax=Ustilaginoidea virens TaxID=1159556 RepID=A0A8E5MED7_USTVR|nr:uncharacterized protein UV8b_00478 [Ustilaginoidea virens]QUC16237.1 hypothetical protein UV8b_00478 [Ustilaginoidea virens]
MLDARFSMLGSRFDKHQRQIHFNFEQFPAASVADDSSFHSPYLAPTEAGLASCATSRNIYPHKDFRQATMYWLALIMLLSALPAGARSPACQRGCKPHLRTRPRRAAFSVLHLVLAAVQNLATKHSELVGRGTHDIECCARLPAMHHHTANKSVLANHPRVTLPLAIRKKAQHAVRTPCVSSTPNVERTKRAKEESRVS